MPSTRRIGPVEVTAAAREEAIAAIVALVANRSARVAGFANAHTVDLARRSPEIARAFARVLLFNDGVALDLWSRAVWGERFPANLNGTDLTPAILHALPPGTRIFLLGDKPEVAAAAAAAVARTFPHLVVAGHRDGFFADAAAVAAQVAAARPDLVIVGMGQPRQELWALDAVATVGCPMLCVGAWLGFVSGTIARAPALVREAKLEWAWRLALEPRRLADRYLAGALRLAAGIAAHRREVRGRR